jgi:hypothetical protein
MQTPQRSTLARTSALLVLALSASLHAQTTRNVGPGQTYTTIQSGINAANAGDTVLVAPGTYFENIDFQGKYISVTSSAGAATTVIDGSKSNSPAVTIAPGSNPLPGIGLPILLQGFTIQNGGTEPSTAPTGGIYINQMLPTITLNILTHNHCAGIWIAETQGLIQNAPLILSNEIDNTLDNDGDCPIGGGSAIVITGGLPQPQIGASGIVGNLIQNNTQGGQEGTGSSGISVLSGSLIIQNNTLHNNITANAGGAIYLAVTAAPVIQNLIYDNQAACGGGAIAIDRGLTQAGGTLQIDSNTFLDNTLSAQPCVTSISQANASQIFLDDTSTELVGTLFANNIFSGDTTEPTIACSPVNAANGIVDLPIFDHNILYNHGGPLFDPATCVDQSSLYQNNTSDPQFVDPLHFDFHLKSSSPAIDAGQTYLVTEEAELADTPIDSRLDIDGQPRVVDASEKGYAIVDMGAYEYGGTQDTVATSLQITNSLESELVIPAAGGATLDLYANTYSPVAAASGCTGPVQFFEDGAAIGTVTLSNSTATLNNFFLTPGTHYINATYSGQPPCTMAEATPHIFLVSPYTTSLSLTSNNNPSSFGNPVTFVATITSPDTNQAGPLYLTDESGTIPLATLTPVNGTASFTTSTLAVGDHNIALDYRGDSTHHASDAGVLQSVLAATALVPTTTTVAVSPNPSTYGQPVLFSAHVAPVAPNKAVPTGRVRFTFCRGAETDATLDASGDASFVAPVPNAIAEPVSSCAFTGQYFGDTTFAPSTSATDAYVVIPSPSTTTILSASPNPAYLSQPVSFTVQITGVPSPTADPVTGNPLPPGTTQATGTVSLYDGSALIGSAPALAGPSGNLAVITTSTLSLGSHTITASYSNDPNLGNSVSAPVTEVITAAPPPDFSLNGTDLTFTVLHSGTGSLQLASINNFAGTIALTCNPPYPVNYTCTLQSPSVSLTAGGSSVVAFNLNYTETASVSSETKIILAAFFPLTLLSLTGLTRKRRTTLRAILSLTLLAILATATTACGSNNAIPITTGTFPLTFTATGASQGASTPITHTVTINATIAP